MEDNLSPKCIWGQSLPLLWRSYIQRSLASFFKLDFVVACYLVKCALLYKSQFSLLVIFGYFIVANHTVQGHFWKHFLSHIENVFADTYSQILFFIHGNTPSTIHLYPSLTQSFYFSESFFCCRTTIFLA